MIVNTIGPTDSCAGSVPRAEDVPRNFALCEMIGRSAPIPSQNANPASPPFPIQSLPSPWIECQDPVSGRLYYVNTQTGHSTWELPVSSQHSRQVCASREHAHMHDAPNVENPTFAQTLARLLNARCTHSWHYPMLNHIFFQTATFPLNFAVQRCER